MAFLKFIVFLSFLTRADSLVLERFYHYTRSPVSDFAFKTLSSSGGGEPILFSSLLYWSCSKNPDINAFRSYTVGMLVNSIMVQGIKYAVNRERPDGGNERSNSSFPSGHSAIAFYVASFYSEIYPRYKVPLYAWATGVALSRVYLKRHWPSDVIVGAALGFTFGKIFYKNRKVFEKFVIF